MRLCGASSSHTTVTVWQGLVDAACPLMFMGIRLCCECAVGERLPWLGARGEGCGSWGDRTVPEGGGQRGSYGSSCRALWKHCKA